MNMIKKVINPHIFNVESLKARSNGIQISKESDVTYIWPVKVKKEAGNFKIISGYYGQLFFEGKPYYDFTKDHLSGKSDKWLQIDVTDKFYDIFVKIYEMNEARKLRKRVKEDKQEFARTLKSIDNPFTEKEFMDILLRNYNIGIFFTKDHERIKAYHLSHPSQYVVKECNGTVYYDNIVDTTRKSVNVYGNFLDKYRISGEYTWETLLHIVNAGQIRYTSMDELKAKVESWRTERREAEARLKVG